MQHARRLQALSRLLVLSLYIPVVSVGLSPTAYLYSVAEFHGRDDTLKIEQRALTSEELDAASYHPLVHFDDYKSIVAQSDAFLIQCLPAFQISVDSTAYLCFRIMNKTDGIVEIPKSEISVTRNLWWGVRTRRPIAIGFEQLYPFPKNKNVTKISIKPQSERYIFVAFKNGKPTKEFDVHLTMVSDDTTIRCSFTLDGVAKL